MTASIRDVIFPHHCTQEDVPKDEDDVDDDGDANLVRRHVDLLTDLEKWFLLEIPNKKINFIWEFQVSPLRRSASSSASSSGS